ncbi:MAG: fructose-bisphosphate aldolase [Armatimonadetes bacterium]|nr:fructose-bisphosphate aldolase [Armatimonadota bacterium]
MTITTKKVTFQDLDLPTGKKARLHRLMYQHGPKNGTMLFLPYDQGLEHGPRDFFDNPDSGDPEYIVKLAQDGGYSGVVFQIGLAEKYMRAFAGKVPLVLKLNGKTEIPADRSPISPLLADVEDAVRLGADAVGYTMYVGSSMQDEDFVQFSSVRKDAERYGMPFIIWAYPRGEAVEAKGGKDSLWAVEYAARVAQEVGADVVKVNFPKTEWDKSKSPKPYDTIKIEPQDAVRRVIQAAGNTMVLISGGEKKGDEDVLDKVRLSMEAGAVGIIFGRNIWQRKYDEAMKVSKQIRDIMLKYGS